MTPKLIAIPFGRDGNKNTIYETRQTGQAENEATWATGFPPITMINKTDGGLPPLGLDFNGIFYDISSNTSYQCMGGQYYFNAEYANKINGYPKGAILLNDANDKQYISNIDNNKVNFNTANTSTLTAWSVISIIDIDKELAKKIDNTDLSTALNLKADKDRQIVAGNGLTGGGTLEKNRTLTLGTPTKITATSTNSVTTSSHTHEIDSASITQKGIVQLTNIVNDETTEALTPRALYRALGNTSALTFVGSGAIMKEGAYGLAGENTKNSPDFNIRDLKNYPRGFSWSYCLSDVTGKPAGNGALLMSNFSDDWGSYLYFRDNGQIYHGSRVRGVDSEWALVYSHANTTTDKSGFLRASGSADALTTADLAQTTGTSTTAAMSQKAVTDIVIGIGQKWTDVTSQRLFNTKYINTSPKPIQLSIQVRSELSKTGRYEFKVDDKVILTDGGLNHIWSSVISAIIPPGSSYLLSNINFADPQIVIWSELR